MFDRFLQRWRRTDAGQPPARPDKHLVPETQPAVIYAIGDVHGCLDLLKLLEASIAADAATIVGERWIVMLGDLVDRGNSSAQVIDHLLAAPPAGFHRFCLMGNHEAMMLDFLARPRAKAAWLDYGGRETLISYGIPAGRLMHGTLNDRSARQLVESYVPAEHIEFLAGLPLTLQTQLALFVHAGLRPGVRLAEQSDADLTGYRDDFAADFAEFGTTVVHGHVIRETPLLTPNRIAIDTGAYLNGRLSAVRVMPDAEPQILTATRPGAGGRQAVLN